MTPTVSGWKPGNTVALEAPNLVVTRAARPTETRRPGAR